MHEPSCIAQFLPATSHIYRVFSLVFIVGLISMGHGQRQLDPREIDAVLPRLIQVVMAGGDRFLAGNLASIRALVADANRMTPDQIELLARVHEDAAWMNPANEDNYYVAGNILPWNGQLEAGQNVLKMAMDARPFDWLPVFFYAFDIWYFEKDGLRAGEALRLAIPRATDEADRLTLETLSVRWMERGYDTRSAIQMVKAMEANSRHSRLRKYYQARIKRLEGLLDLEDATERFIAKVGKPPTDLRQLVENGFIAEVPSDPFRLGYDLDKNGRPVLRNKPGGAKK